MRKKHSLPALLMAIVLLLAFGCAKTAEPAADAPSPAAEATDAPTDAPTEAPAETAAPADAGSGDYSGIAFTSLDLTGSEVTEAYIRENKVTVVNFWATWCPPCVAEIPDFSEVAKEYAAKGCGFLGVLLDDDIDAAKSLWEEKGIVYPSVLPNGDLVALASGMQYVPDTILFDSEGKQIGEMHVGGLSKAQLTALIDEALAAQ